MTARLAEPRPPVLMLAPPRFIGPLGVMRSLRPWGVRIYSLAHVSPSIANASRWCAGRLAIGSDGRPLDQPEERILEALLAAGRRLGEGAILVAGSDEWTVFASRYRHELSTAFAFPDLPLELALGLASKKGLHKLAALHGLPTPRILAPASADELAAAAGSLDYPVMLKPIESRPGSQALTLVERREQLLPSYQAMGQPGSILCQEYIPGSDLDVWVYNGYLDARSRALASFTGRKVRQHPPHMGLIALGVCETNDEVRQMTERFLAQVGYQGIVDIGYRFDKRDGRYKVLDINPRLGGAFRLFVDRNGLDVMRAMYLDLTGRPVPAVEPREGRKWMLEAGEILSWRHYRRDRGLTLRGWLRSLRGLEEGATFSIRDPLPFLVAMRILWRDTFGGRRRRLIERARGLVTVRKVMAGR